ncbi:MAG: polysaccharide biosynthesis protein [Clostridia bacterium]|nr:polysaccharide biosynthesis protein [Clostridia bacterium]
MRFATRTNQFILDGLILSLAYWFSFMLRFEGTLDQRYSTMLLITWPYAVLLHFLALHFSGSLRISWRFISLKDVLRIILALFFSCTLLLISRAFFGDFLPTSDFSAYATIPYGVILINFILNILGITGLRALHRIIVEHHQFIKHGSATPKAVKRTLLVGAGDSGATIIKEISSRPDMGMAAVGFVDDDQRKIGTTILGYKVLGTIDQLNSVCQKEHVEQILITINDISAPQMRRITTICQSTGLQTKIIPGVHELVNGNLSLQKIRPVSIDDLLGRKAVKLDLDLISPLLENKVILVTGAGGSIGSELCRQISHFKPQTLLLLEQAENPLFAINNELIAQNVNTVPLIADITDRPRIESIFKQFSPDIVFHAAAHKHVPLMEANPPEAIKNNVTGTRIMAETADKFHVGAFLMISTDKAVNPSSIMGASKRIAELVIQSISQNSKTKFVAVRFGNVLGSSGSVIPTFMQQIKNGGPVTVTHPDMQRYFMTIPEACQLVLEAISLGEGGEIFILDMGTPVKIVDLARDLISLSGFRPDSDIKIVFTGIRPGEKLFEELSVAKESADKTKHPKIFIGHIIPPENSNEFLLKVTHLEEMAKQNSQNISSLIKEIVPEYIGSNNG